MAGPNTIAFQGSNETANASTSEIPVSAANPLPVTLGSGASASEIQGAIAAGSLNTANPVKTGGVFNTTYPTYTNGEVGDTQLTVRGFAVTAIGDGTSAAIAAVAQPSSDAIGTAANGLSTRSLGYLFNGSTLDRSRSITGIDGSGLGVMAVEQGGASWANITTGATTVVKSGAGTLHKIIINTPVASATLTLYNNTSAAGNKIGTITLPSTITGETPISLEYDLYFSLGLTIVTSGATDLTVVYR